MLTVRDVVGDLDISVVAGEASLAAPVRWVHISELPDPTPWLSGGELLLTTGMMLGTAKKQRDFVAALADHGLAGIGFGTGFSHPSVPAAMIEAADARGLALLEIPYEVPFIAVTEQAFTRLVNEQYALLQRSIAAQERLQRIVLSERGLDVDRRSARRRSSAARRWSSTGAASSRRTARSGASSTRDSCRSSASSCAIVRGGPSRASSCPRPRRRWRCPSARRRPRARTACRRRGSSPPRTRAALAEIDRLILHQAVTVIALELLRRRVADTTERRLAGDILSSAITGELEGTELGRRLEPFGLGGRVTTLVLAPGERRAEACERALSEVLRGESVSALVARHGRFVCALMPGFLDDELFELGERVRSRVAAATELDVPAGAGRVVVAGDVRKSWHEARFALEAREMSERASGAEQHTSGNGSGGGAPEEPEGSRPIATSAASSCCSRFRTRTRSVSTATRCWDRSRTARATTAAS